MTITKNDFISKESKKVKSTNPILMIEDNIIKYDDEAKKIYFAGNITSFVFYNQLFSALREHYKKNGAAVAPFFSFIYVDRFDPLVVPNLISLGFILKSIHKKPVCLDIESTKATKFLDNGWFFMAVGREKIFSEELDIDGSKELKTVKQETGYELYDFEPKMLGFYNVSISYNPDHRVCVYRDESYSYYSKFIQEGVSEEELGIIRSEKYRDLKPVIAKRYWNILKELNDNNKCAVLDILTEIITNSILYSGSNCSAMLQTKDNETKISISDYGVGFEYSFEKRQKKLGEEYKNVFNEFSTEEQEKYKNFMYIFETLYYSKAKSVARDNLFTLLGIVLRKNDNFGIAEGTIRIHYNDTQVILTSKKCATCNKFDPKNCAKCLLSKYNPAKEVSKSNLRIFNSTFRGVHVEVELKFKDDVVR